MIDVTYTPSLIQSGMEIGFQFVESASEVNKRIGWAPVGICPYQVVFKKRT